MDHESLLADVLALAGEDPDAIREGVRVALSDCEAIFRLQQPKKRMRDQAAHACRALCRARVAEELHRRRGTRIGEHLKLVLSIIATPWSRSAPVMIVGGSGRGVTGSNCHSSS
jgi:hypothetical protein